MNKSLSHSFYRLLFVLPVVISIDGNDNNGGGGGGGSSGDGGYTTNKIIQL